MLCAQQGIDLSVRGLPMMAKIAANFGLNVSGK